MIQYVSAAGQPRNGPHFMDLYRQIQAAGRGVDIDVPAEHVEYLVRRLRPELLILRTRARTEEQAHEMVENAARWAGSDLNRS